MKRLIISSAAALLIATALGTSARSDDFLQQEGDQWRASKLVGVNIYSPDNKKVGDISDVLMTKDGKAAYVVVGVGGFLGIGEKNVAIPFEKVKFSQEPVAIAAAPAGTMAPANTPAAGGAAPGTAPANGNVAPNAMGTPAKTDGNTPAMTGATSTPAAPRTTAYPDHGMVEYTVDQLKAAPTFAFAK